MSGVYLSFMWGSTQFENMDNESGNLYDAVNDIRNFINNNYKSFVKYNFNEQMDLASGSSLPKSYERASIVFKYYDINNIPDEEELVQDLKNYLNFYKFAKENYNGRYISLIKTNEFNKDFSAAKGGIGDEDIKTVHYWVLLRVKVQRCGISFMKKE